MVQQTQFTPGPGPVSKHVFWYEGSDQLKAGYLLCLNTDRGTAADVDGQRGTRVEKPSISNLHAFAGVVMETGKPLLGGPCEVTLIVPTQSLQMVRIFCDVDTVIDVTEICLAPGSYIGNQYGAGPVIARAAQTLDTDTINALVQCNLYGMTDGLRRRDNQVYATKSRTAVELPTAAIWDHIPIDELRQNPWRGSLLDTDFTGGANTAVGQVTFLSASEATILTGAGALGIGELIAQATTANEGWGIGWNVPIVVSGDLKWGFEVRLHVDSIDDGEAGLFVGLCKYSDTLLVTSILTSDAPPVIVDEAAVGFQIKETDNDIFDFVYNENGRGQQEFDQDYHTIVASAYVTLGLYFNGTTIQGYLNGVATGDAITAVQIAHADFPTAEILRPCLGYVADDQGGFVTTVDWIRCAQVGAL